MDGDKHDYASLPIPTYEEATSSRPSSAQNYRGPEEISDDAERQGLLGQHQGAGGGAGAGNQQNRRNGGYRPPTAESPRSSEDSDLHLPEVTGEDDEDEEEERELRRDMEEMEVLEPETGRQQRRTRMRRNLSKRLTTITNSLSSLSLPSFRRISFPSFRLPSIPEGYRVSWPIIARLFGLFVIATLIWMLFAFDIIPNRGHLATQYDPESVRVRVQAEVDETRIADYLKYVTSFDHVAGTEGDLYLAKWVEEMWGTALLDDVEILDYFVYLNYPTKDGRKVAIVDPPEMAWTAKLEEDSVYADQGRARQQTYTFHGHSKSGTVKGPLVYANGGSREDFEKLKDMGVDMKGKIALVRYYHTQGDRALKVKAAELAGAAGCLIYSDPMEDGFLKGEPLPKGRWRPADAVQRGAVSLMSWVVGDPLTPGWASTINSPRVSEKDNPGLVNIPSLPLAWRDAQRLLQVLQGHGYKVPADWVGGVPDVSEWWTGSSTSPTVLLQNEQDESKLQQIWNVHGIITGMETPQKKIIVGNHRDSWCFGAVDPGSGTAVLMEVVNIFGTLRKLGWRPLRSIEFVSWDAEEYNLVGSTEYVEDQIDTLRAHGLAYLNVDVGVFGDKFRAAASPLYQRVLLHVLDRVSDPVQNVSLRTLWERSNTQLEGLGAGSDYVAFQDLAGVSSLDFGFEGPENGYPYHSCYETYEYMSSFGDPGFQYHRALAQVWALLILELADAPIVPFDLQQYATAVRGYISTLEADATAAGAPEKSFSVSKLREAGEFFAKQAKEFHAFEDYWTREVLGRGGFESNAFAIRRIEYNERLVGFEKDLLDLPRQGDGFEAPPYGVSCCYPCPTTNLTLTR